MSDPFLIGDDFVHSLAISGQPPVDREALIARHEAAVAAFRLKGQ